tara:strand:+ start:965 stop:1285 length:321 start_codon:yes stop_codon:yes gene_type:complete
MDRPKSNLIKELIFLYVTENYKKYLENNNLKTLDEKDIPKIIESIYIEKKKDLKIWLKECLKKLQGDEYMGDLAFNQICLEIFQDDNYCKERLVLEIKLYQEKNNI